MHGAHAVVPGRFLQMRPCSGGHSYLIMRKDCFLLCTALTHHQHEVLGASVSGTGRCRCAHKHDLTQLPPPHLLHSMYAPNLLYRVKLPLESLGLHCSVPINSCCYCCLKPALWLEGSTATLPTGWNNTVYTPPPSSTMLQCRPHTKALNRQQNARI